MANRKRPAKHAPIEISSSSEPEDEDEDEDEEILEDDSDETAEEIDISSSSTSNEDDDEDDDDDDEYYVGEGNESVDGESSENQEDSYDDAADKDEESMCNNVIRLLRERSNLKDLKLSECKAYLRKHGLRLSGTRAECMKRIMEHWRIKDGRGEALYPRSSFTIDCTGDVCKGDVVLFTQKVYNRFDKMTRSGKVIGKRTIAGRVVKESYGAARQQHTFTVEVLWNKGVKKLPPLSPLLVKGRNLYKLKTYRQCWNNEKARSKVLDEKHKRGAAARFIRAMRKSKTVNRAKKLSSKTKGKQPAKHFQKSRHSQVREKTEVDNDNHIHGRAKDVVGDRNRASYNHRMPSGREQSSSVLTRNSGAPISQRGYAVPVYPNHVERSSFQLSYPPGNIDYSQAHIYHRRQQHDYPYGDQTSSSAMNSAHFGGLHSPPMTASAQQEHNHAKFPHYAHPTYVSQSSTSDERPSSVNIHRSFHQLSKRSDRYGQRF